MLADIWHVSLFLCTVSMIHTLRISRSVQGARACGWAWAVSPACRPAAWTWAARAGRTPSRLTGSPESRVTGLTEIYEHWRYPKPRTDRVQAILCNYRRDLFLLYWPKTRQFIYSMRLLTVTSLPRLISASTFFMPSPLPTCQMVASAGWLVIGQSLACSSYQIVLKAQWLICQLLVEALNHSTVESRETHSYPKAYTSAALEKGKRSSLLPGLILRTISGAR